MAQWPILERHMRLSIVACPVSRYLATSTVGDIHCHLINPETGHRVRAQPRDPKTCDGNRKTLARGDEFEKAQSLHRTDMAIKSVSRDGPETRTSNVSLRASRATGFEWMAAR
jgi:DNA end-binding protein Ku